MALSKEIKPYTACTDWFLMCLFNERHVVVTSSAFAKQVCWCILCDPARVECAQAWTQAESDGRRGCKCYGWLRPFCKHLLRITPHKQSLILQRYTFGKRLPSIKYPLLYCPKRATMFSTILSTAPFSVVILFFLLSHLYGTSEALICYENDDNVSCLLSVICPCISYTIHSTLFP